MTAELSIWRRLLNGWIAIAGRFGFVQTLLILVLFYTVIIGPAALLVGISRRDFLGKRGLGDAGSAWLDADSTKPDLERAKLTS